MEARGMFLFDLTQPAGLNTKVVRTFVTRCLVGEPGITYVHQRGRKIEVYTYVYIIYMYVCIYKNIINLAHVSPPFPSVWCVCRYKYLGLRMFAYPWTKGQVGP